jgi:hypothetical protein
MPRSLIFRARVTQANKQFDHAGNYPSKQQAHIARLQPGMPAAQPNLSLERQNAHHQN